MRARGAQFGFRSAEHAERHAVVAFLTCRPRWTIATAVSDLAGGPVVEVT